MQEKNTAEWDDYINYFTSAHNSSTSVYGFEPETLMFGYTKPRPTDLLQFWPDTNSHQDYAEKIIPQAENLRTISQARTNKNKARNLSYKNTSRIDKTFKIGSIVAHRELQLATSKANSMNPKFKGPYIVIALDPDNCSATLEHLHNGNQMRAHFTNLTIINFNPAYNRLHQNFDEDLQDLQKLLTDPKPTIPDDDSEEEIQELDQPAIFHDDDGPISYNFTDERYTDQPTSNPDTPIHTDPGSNNESIAGIDQTFNFTEDQNDFNDTADPQQEDPAQTQLNDSNEQLTPTSHSPNSSFGNMTDSQDHLNDLIDYLNRTPTPVPPAETENTMSNEFIQGEFYTPDECYPEN